VNPTTIQRLLGYAEKEGETLRDLVRYILSAYEPPEEGPPEG
jgi:hypothetical protein